VGCRQRPSSFTNLETEIRSSRRSVCFLWSSNACFPAHRAVKNGVIFLDRRRIGNPNRRRKIFQLSDCPLDKFEIFFVFCHALDYRNSTDTRIQPKNLFDHGLESDLSCQRSHFQTIPQAAGDVSYERSPPSMLIQCFTASVAASNPANPRQDSINLASMNFSPSKAFADERLTV
jgi:hypothetical protein